MTKAWEDHKEAIIGEYKQRNKPLHEVQRIMEETHGFRASTRAYRSRLDKWGVFKYSCRRRRRSSAGARSGSADDEDTPMRFGQQTPEQDESDSGALMGSGSPGSPSISPRSPLVPPVYNSGDRGGSSSVLRSPMNPMRMGSQSPQPHYFQSQLAPPLRYGTSPPNSGFMDSHFRYPSHTPYYEPVDRQQHAIFASDFYRGAQGYPAMNMGINAGSLPTSPSPGYSQLHQPAGCPVVYPGYSVGQSSAKRPPE